MLCVRRGFVDVPFQSDRLRLTNRLAQSLELLYAEETLSSSFFETRHTASGIKILQVFRPSQKRNCKQS